ncbi:Os08g0114225 [Oryza sativa Japonica Group]|uniref:Os08g0114225 protein n=1 Tax=Oryza sativa subsp. japonica TaxID=39947 RepID=A0A0P0XAW7_ORYSJ|nr:hypothetical protein EE612_041774 [Oryza sativa]BAT03542.1 Os08g0114225 [Oryza sativa Japonica Group]
MEAVAEEALGEEHLGAHPLVVPAEGVVVVPGAELHPVRLHVRHERRVPRRAVQPRRPPQELVVVARVGAVERAHRRRQRVAVRPAVPVGEVEHLRRGVEEARGVGRVGAAEHHGRRGERGGRLAGDVGTRLVGGDAVDAAGCVHVLGALPAAVVLVGVGDLDVERAGRGGGGLEEVVGAPAHGGAGVGQLGAHELAEVEHAPRQHRRRERHGQAELDVVAGVVVPAHQIHPLYWAPSVRPESARHGMRLPGGSLPERWPSKKMMDLASASA